MRFCWRSCSPRNRRKPSPLAIRSSTPTAARPSASCFPFAICNSGLSTTFCWSLPPRRSRKKTPRLCPRPARASIARSAPATMFSCSRASRAQPDSCSDPKCYAAKVDAHVRQTVAAKPKLVQISTAYGQPKDGSAAVPRNKYVEIRSEKPTNQKQRDWPEYKTCKFTTEAIVTEGSEKGELRARLRESRMPRASRPRSNSSGRNADAVIKAEQEKRRREEAIAQATGLARLERHRRSGSRSPDEARPAFRGRASGRRYWTSAVWPSFSVSTASASRKTPPTPRPSCLRPFFRKSDESTLGRLLVEMVILQSMHSRTTPAKSCAKPPSSTRWTWPQSPPRSSRSSPRRTRRRP